MVAGGVLLLALLFSAILSGLISRPLRAMADAPPPPAAADIVDTAPVDPAAEAAGRQRFFALAAQLRGAAHG